MKKIISTEKAPAAIGPYSQAVVCGNMVYTSGCLGMDPGTGIMFETVEEQAHAVFNNLKVVLEEANSGMDCVVKTLVLVSDLENYATINEIYGQYFTAPYPARSAFEVARLPKDALLEVEAIAYVKE